MKYIELFENLKFNITEILIAAKTGSVSRVIKAIQNGENVDAVDSIGRTPLMIAALDRYISVLVVLLKYNANVDAQDTDGRTALMMSSTSKSVQALLNANANVNIVSHKGENVAMNSLKYEDISKRYIDFLEMFISKGLNLDHKDNNHENIYDIIKRKEDIFTDRHDKLNYYLEIEEYMNNRYPKFKEEWELKRDISTYNL